MLLAQIVDTSTAVAATAARGKKVALLATALRELPASERAVGARYLAGEQPHKTGIGYALVRDVIAQVPAARAATLLLTEVDARLAAIAPLAGAGSAGARKAAFGALLAAATADEQRFLCALVTGELRQGAEASMVVDAVARASGLPAVEVRRAHMLAGDLGAVAAAALGDGADGVARFGLTLFRPVLPMLAQTAADVPGALATFAGPAALELKLDGFRVQLHKDGDEVRAYSRNLNDVTAMMPEAVAAVRAFPARRLVLDGEAIALHSDGRPLPFQDTMARFGRRGTRAPEPGTATLSLALFDALLVDDDTLLAQPASARFGLLGALAPAHAVPRVVTADADVAARFYTDAIARGHEGVMAKALDAPYEAGSRGAAWLKIKKVHRLDLVVLAAEWGSGRRRGWLSNLWLGARDPAGGSFVMLGKTFKGMTDAVLAWQTAELLAREVDRDGHVVHVRPELVAELAFNDVQRSSRYPGGVALRFARLVRYRSDKTAAEADTIDAVRAIAIADGVLSAG